MTNAVAPAVEEAAVDVQRGDRSIAETPWQERRKRCTWWTLGTAQLSVFTIPTGRRVAVLREFVGEW